MRGFLESCVEAYLQLSGRPRSSLRVVPTPYIAEEAGSGPARRPFTEGPSVTCECCGHSWPDPQVSGGDEPGSEVALSAAPAPMHGVDDLHVPHNLRNSHTLHECGNLAE